jgi:hypothetical protein
VRLWTLTLEQLVEGMADSIASLVYRLACEAEVDARLKAGSLGVATFVLEAHRQGLDQNVIDRIIDEYEER